MVSFFTLSRSNSPVQALMRLPEMCVSVMLPSEKY